MKQRLIFSLIASVLVLACATPDPPRFDFTAGSRIGIINHLEDYATHRNFSSLRYSNPGHLHLSVPVFPGTGNQHWII